MVSSAKNLTHSLWILAKGFSNFILKLGSGCGSVGRVVGSDTRGPQFESSRSQNYLVNIFTFNSCKDENKEKEAGKLHFNNSSKSVRFQSPRSPVRIMSIQHRYSNIFLPYGCRHSSVDSSAPSIQPPRVRVPSIPSMLFSNYIFVIWIGMWKERK